MKDRLYNLMCEADIESGCVYGDCDLKFIADHLIDSGAVIVLPCKVGDTVYIVWSNFDFISCRGCKQDGCESCPYDVYEIAKRPFDYKYLNQPYLYTTKEEAEAKLKELQGE